MRMTRYRKAFVGIMRGEDLLKKALEIRIKQVKAKNYLERSKMREYGGPQGKEPTRFGDWEKNGRVSDF